MVWRRPEKGETFLGLPCIGSLRGWQRKWRRRFPSIWVRRKLWCLQDKSGKGATMLVSPRSASHRGELAQGLNPWPLCSSAVPWSHSRPCCWLHRAWEAEGKRQRVKRLANKKAHCVTLNTVLVTLNMVLNLSLPERPSQARKEMVTSASGCTGEQHLAHGSCSANASL